MSAIKIHSVLEQDGVLRVAGLPYHRGDHVDVTLSLINPPDESQRNAARTRFLDRSRRSTLRSVGPYPTRDQLHERA